SAGADHVAPWSADREKYIRFGPYFVWFAFHRTYSRSCPSTASEVPGPQYAHPQLVHWGGAWDTSNRLAVHVAPPSVERETNTFTGPFAPPFWVNPSQAKNARPLESTAPPPGNAPPNFDPANSTRFSAHVAPPSCDADA